MTKIEEICRNADVVLHNIIKATLEKITGELKKEEGYRDDAWEYIAKKYGDGIRFNFDDYDYDVVEHDLVEYSNFMVTKRLWTITLPLADPDFEMPQIIERVFDIEVKFNWQNN